MQSFQPCRIQSDHNKQQNGKAPERRATVAEKRERNADNRHNSKYHTHIHHQMEEENTRHTIAVHPAESIPRSLGHSD